MTLSQRRYSALALGVLAVAGAPAFASPPKSVGGPTYDQRASTAFVPGADRSWRARLIVSTRSRLAPGFAAKAGPLIQPDAPYAGGPQVFLVLGAQRALDRSLWFRVLLPDRPNGRSAWLPADALRVDANPWRVRVSLAARRLDLLRAGRVQQSWRVAVGQSAYPTPIGRFAISEVVAQTNPAGFFGPVIMTLTGHSDTLSDFDGGDGRVALHGTNRPSLLGSAASHGCIRLPNAAARRIAQLAPTGTPVEIH